MEGRQGKGKTGPASGEAQAGGDRFEAMLEERFSATSRRAFARELALHDQRRAATRPQGAAASTAASPVTPAAPLASQLPLTFSGPVEEPVRKALSAWLPPLLEYANRLGLDLGGALLQLRVYGRKAFEVEQGALPKGLPLPASSYQHDQLNRRYTVRLVLPEPLGGMGTLVAAVRAVLARVCGDLFLRERVWPRVPYRDSAPAAVVPGGASGAALPPVGLDGQLRLLAEAKEVSASLEPLLAAHARRAGLDLRRNPDEARRSFMHQLTAQAALGPLPPEEETAVRKAFATYLERVRDALPEAQDAALKALDALDRQVHFLPPMLEPEYAALRTENRTHFLRSARMRLGFITRALSGVLEDFAALEAPQASVPPMLPDRVEGTLAELEHEGLAQACLVPGVKLSAEREAERRALPMEAHKLLQRLAPGSDPAKRHRVLVKRLESHLHQRVYNALVFLRHWAGLREKQKDAGFSRSSAYAELKSLAANFRHRLGALQTLEARLELVLYLMESLPGASGAHPPAQEFPREVFARAWGQFAGHALVAAVFGSGKIKGFAASRHWAETEARLKEQAQAGSAVALISLLLRRVQQRFSTETTDPGSGLAELVEVLLAGDGTFRFTIAQAAGLHTATRSTPGTPVPLRPLTVPERLMHLDAWAGVIADTASARARNAIRPGLK